MSTTFYPRLSEARHLLPLLRSHLIATASRYPLPVGLVDLLPIVEDDANQCRQNLHRCLTAIVSS